MAGSRRNSVQHYVSHPMSFLITINECRGLSLMSLYVLEGWLFSSHVTVLRAINPSSLPFSFSSTMFLFTVGVCKRLQSWQAEVWGGNLYVSVLIAFSWLHTVICYPHSFPSTPIETQCVSSNNSCLEPSSSVLSRTFFAHWLYLKFIP